MVYQECLLTAGQCLTWLTLEQVSNHSFSASVAIRTAGSALTGGEAVLMFVSWHVPLRAIDGSTTFGEIVCEPPIAIIRRRADLREVVDAQSATSRLTAVGTP